MRHQTQASIDGALKYARSVKGHSQITYSRPSMIKTFVCDSSAAIRAFIRQNVAPNPDGSEMLYFTDVETIAAAVAKDADGTLQIVPTNDNSHSAGFPCRGFSQLRTHDRHESAEASVTSRSTHSGAGMHGVGTFVQNKSPRHLFNENVQSLPH